MGWKRFVAELVASLAWPTLIGLTLLIFKAELTKVASRLAKVKYKDLEVDFDKVRQHAEELEIDSKDETPALQTPVFKSLEDQILDAVERAPSAAILLAWSALESAIAAAVSRLAISPDAPSYRSPAHNIDVLAKHGRLSKSHEHLLREMRTLRNKIAHGRDELLAVTQNQAMDYATTALDLIRHFEKYGSPGITAHGAGRHEQQ